MLFFFRKQMFCFSVFRVIFDNDQYKSWSYIESGFYKYLDINFYEKTKQPRSSRHIVKSFLFLKWICEFYDKSFSSSLDCFSRFEIEIIQVLWLESPLSFEVQIISRLAESVSI